MLPAFMKADIREQIAVLSDRFMVENNLRPYDLIRISNRNSSIVVPVKGGGVEGRIYLGKPVWDNLGLTLQGGLIRFEKVSDKVADSVVIITDSEVPSEKIKTALEHERIYINKRIDKIIDGRLVHLIIKSISPEDATKVSDQTRILVELRTEPKLIEKSKVLPAIATKSKEDWKVSDFFVEIPKITLSDIFGNEDAVERIKFYCILPLQNPEILLKHGFRPGPVLIYGPAGSGKSSLVYAIANETKAKYILIAPYLLAQREMLQEIFSKILEIVKNSAEPIVIHIEDIERFVPKQEFAFERGFTNIFMKFIKDIESCWNNNCRVILIAETRSKESINKILLESGTFKEEIEVDIPNENIRRKILERRIGNNSNVDIDRIVKMTHGFSGDDLINLINKAIINSIKRSINNKCNVYLTTEDFEKAIREITPSALKEFAIEIPSISWNDIGGYHETKKELQRIIEWPMKYRDIYLKYIGSPPKGVMLFGPPGCGKTMFAKAVANAATANFISVKGPELTSKYFGESEERIRELFRKAKKSAPSIIFFDEIDAIAKKRGEGHEATERIVAQLLTEMDGVEQLQDVLVIAATNRIDTIDTAILRPGRFDKLIYIPAPDRDAIKAILQVKTRKLPGISNMSAAEFNDFLETVTEMIIREETKKTIDVDEAIDYLKKLDIRDKEDIDDIVSKIKVSEDRIIASKYIGADIEAIVKESAKLAMVEEIELRSTKGVTLEHFKKAIKVCPPSLSWREYLIYESQRVRFRRGL